MFLFQPFQLDCIETTKKETFCNMWHIYALSSVLQCPIRSIYPDCNRYIRPLLNRVVSPRIQPTSTKAVLHVMWTRTTQMTPSQWTPNHFVPCILVDTVHSSSNTICQSSPHQTTQAATSDHLRQKSISLHSPCESQPIIYSKKSVQIPDVSTFLLRQAKAAKQKNVKHFTIIYQTFNNVSFKAHYHLHLLQQPLPSPSLATTSSSKVHNHFVPPILVDTVHSSSNTICQSCPHQTTQAATSDQKSNSLQPHCESKSSKKSVQIPDVSTILLRQAKAAKQKNVSISQFTKHSTMSTLSTLSFASTSPSPSLAATSSSKVYNLTPSYDSDSYCDSDSYYDSDSDISEQDTPTPSDPFMLDSDTTKPLASDTSIPLDESQPMESDLDLQALPFPHLSHSWYGKEQKFYRDVKRDSIRRKNKAEKNARGELISLNRSQVTGTLEENIQALQNLVISFSTTSQRKAHYSAIYQTGKYIVDSGSFVKTQQAGAVYAAFKGIAPNRTSCEYYEIFCQYLNLIQSLH